MKNYKKDIINHIGFNCPVMVKGKGSLYALIFVGVLFLGLNLMKQKLPNELDYSIFVIGFLLLSFLICFFYCDSLERRMIAGFKNLENRFLHIWFL